MSIDVDVYTLIVLFSWAIKHCNFTWNNLGTLSKHSANRGKNDTLFMDWQPQEPLPYTWVHTYTAHLREYPSPTPVTNQSNKVTRVQNLWTCVQPVIKKEQGLGIWEIDNVVEFI